MSAVIDVIGLKEASIYFERQPEVAARAARLAVNQVTERRGMKLARDAMLEQIAFPSGYLYPPRFSLTQRATDRDLTAVIRGQFTPTPLARFSGSARTNFIGGRRSGRSRGVTVQIKPGSSVKLDRAFFIRLRSGNIGLGIRLREGEILRNTIGAKLITTGSLSGVALLYGPSVDQVFRTVALDIAPEILRDLEAEFLRQFVRLSR